MTTLSRRGASLLLAALMTAVLAVCAASAFAEAPAAGHAGPAASAEHQPAAQAPTAEHGEAAGHDGWVWPLVARLFNFAVLVGTLVYFLRKPFATYLQNRSAQIRRDLVEAEELRQSAEAQMAEIEAKLRALPGEIETLRRQGSDELAAEEARLRAAAEAERVRLVEQARREIDLAVRVAKQELRREAADLAVGVASERIKAQLTPEAHLRLVDRYADQVSRARGVDD